MAFSVSIQIQNQVALSEYSDNGAVETKRTVVVNYPDQVKTYSVKTIDGKEMALSTGDELKTMGIEVNITERYGVELFEISLSN